MGFPCSLVSSLVKLEVLIIMKLKYQTLTWLSFKAISCGCLWPISALGTMNLLHTLRMNFIIYNTYINRCKTVKHVVVKFFYL